MRDALEVALEVGQPLAHRLHSGEVIGCEDLALHDREVDFDLVEPLAWPDRNRDHAGVGLRKAPHQSIATMRGAWSMIQETQRTLL